MTAVMRRCAHLREPCSKQNLVWPSFSPVFTPLRPSLSLSWSPGLAQALHIRCILVLSRAESAFVLGLCGALTWLSPTGKDPGGGSCWEETSHFSSFTRFLYVLQSREACFALSRLNCSQEGHHFTTDEVGDLLFQGASESSPEVWQASRGFWGSQSLLRVFQPVARSFRPPSWKHWLWIYGCKRQHRGVGIHNRVIPSPLHSLSTY